MRLLAIDCDSAALDLLMRAQLAGHEVVWFNRPKRDCKAGHGIVKVVTDLEEIKKKWLGWAELIYLTGNSKYLDILEPYRALGYPIFGSNAEASTWEIDRAIGQQVMKECGLPIIPGKEFRDHESAISHVKRHRVPFVSKPNGDAKKELSYVAESGADLVFMLERWSKDEKYRADAKEHGFILQEKKVGCEMGASGWFGPSGWSQYWEEAFEYKKLYAGDSGPNTGEQGTCTRFVSDSKLADLVLKPLTKKLHEIQFVGNVNVNCIIDEEGVPWPLEFTMRDGWPARYNEISLQEGDPVQWMLDLVNGKDTMRVRENAVSISVVVTIPDYPFSTYTGKKVEGIPIYGAGDREHVHLCEVMLDDSVPTQMGDKIVYVPGYVTAGDYVMVITGTGETITGARRSAYAALEKVKIPNSPGWRPDIGKGKLVTTLPKIQKHGYATDLSF